MTKQETIIILRGLIPFILLVFFSCFYISLQSTTVFGGDTGDLLSAIAVRGVPHPSGYPLYTMIGLVLKYLPLHFELAWKVGIASAFFSSATIAVIYLVVFRIWKNAIYGVLASLTLAFAFPFWLFAEVTEVISLHHFLLAVIFLSALLFKQTAERRYFFLTAFLCGLSLTNNESSLLLFPGVFLLTVGTFWNMQSRLRSVFFSIACFLFGLFPYVYIPFAAANHPFVNWNDATSFKNFLNLVLRKDYGWVNSNVTIGTLIRVDALQRYIEYFFRELLFVGAMAVGLGFISSLILKKNRTVPISIFLSFLFFGPLFFVYSATPAYDHFSLGSREKFMGSSFIFAVLILPYAIDFIWKCIDLLLLRIKVPKKRILAYSKSFSVFFLILPALLFFKNYSVLRLSNVTIARQTAIDMLSPLPDKSVLVSETDNIIFPTWYVQYGLGLKKEVFATFTHELLSLANRGLLHRKGSIGESVSSLDELAPSLLVPVYTVEYDRHKIMKGDRVVVYPYAMVWRYVSLGSTAQDEESFVKTQNILLSKLADPAKYISKEQQQRLWLLANFRTFYSDAYVNTGFFLMYAYHDYEKASNYFAKAILLDDENDNAFEGLGISYYKNNDYKRAKNALEQAVSIQPLNKNAYYLLYGAEVALHDSNRQKELEGYFQDYEAIYSDFLYKKTRVFLP